MLFRREGLEELEAREKVRVVNAPGAAYGVDGSRVEEDHRSPQGAVLLPERLRLGQVGAVVEQHKLLRHRGRRRAAADQEVARMRVSVHKARDENLVRKQVDHELCRSVAAEARRL